MRYRRRFALRHVRACLAPRIRALTRLVGGIDRSPQYLAEVRRLSRLDTFQDDLIRLHDAVESEVSHGWSARELVHQMGTQRAGPALAGAA